MNLSILVNELEILANAPNGMNLLRTLILDLALSGELSEDKIEFEPKLLGDIAAIRTGKLDANASSENGRYPFFTCAKDPLRISTFSYDTECALLAGNGNFDVNYYSGKFDAYQRTYILEPKNKEELFVPYLYRFMQSHARKLTEQSIGGVIKYLKIGFLTSAPIQIPSYSNQKLIAAVIDSLMSKCDQLEALQNKSDSLINAARKSAIDEVSSAQTPEDLQNSWKRIEGNWDVIAGSQESIGDLRSLILELEMKSYLIDNRDTNSKEKNWSSAPLREVCEYIQRGKSPKYAAIGSCRVVSQKCVRWSGFDSAQSRFIEVGSIIGYSSERFLQDGDLLWNSTGTGTVGRTALFKSETPGQRFVADSHVTVLRSTSIHPEYLYYWSRSPDIQEEVLSSTTGSTNQQELNLGKLKELVITFPSMHEQELTVKRIKGLFALCDQLEVTTKLMNELSRKLVQSVVAVSA